jgi:hypothetical protein
MQSRSSRDRRLEQLEKALGINEPVEFNTLERWKAAHTKGLRLDPKTGEEITEEEWCKRFPERAKAWDQVVEILAIFENPIEKTEDADTPDA